MRTNTNGLLPANNFKLMIYHSTDDTFTAEPFTTVNTTFWIYHKVQIRGRLYIREEGIEIELYQADQFNDNDMLQILSLIKQAKDGCKTLPVEPNTKRIRTDKRN